MDSASTSSALIERGQRRKAVALFPGLIVRVIETSPYRPGEWICRPEPAGARIVIPDSALGELLDDRAG
jgi:hypothetical protein